MSANATLDVPVLSNKDKKALRSPGTQKSKAPNLVLLLIMLVVLGIGIARMAMQPKASPKVVVIAAARDLPAGKKIHFRDLHELIVPTSYKRPDMFNDYMQLVGRTTNSYIAMGEPVLDGQLLPKAQTVAQTLAPHQRAITLKLDGEYGIDNAAQPGDRVDVLATTTAQNGKKYTKTICQDVTVVLSASKDIVLSDRLRGFEENKVTLAVAPEQAETLTQAAETGRLRLVLRSPANHAQVVLPGADDRDLLPHFAQRVQGKQTIALDSDADEALPPPPQQSKANFIQQLPEAIAAPAQWFVDVFQGSKKETYEFPQKQ